MRRTLPWIAALLAGCVVVLAWMAFVRDRGAAERAGTAERAEARASLVAGGETAPADAPKSAGERRALATPAAVDAPDADAVPAPSKPPIGALRVRVVFAGDGAPAAGAEVDVAATSLRDEERRLHDYERYGDVQPYVRPMPWHDPFGAGRFDTLRADVEGCVDLRRPLDRLQLRARAVRGGVVHRGEREEQPRTARDTAGELWLELRPERSATVRVIDPRGAPVVGLAVAIVRTGEPPQVLEVARTDANGLARLVERDTPWDAAREQGAELVVRAVAVLSPPLEAPLAAADDASPIELVLPPTGSVVLTLERSAIAATTRLRALDMDARIAPARALDEDGRASYPYVGLGLTLEAQVFGVDTSAPETFAGPVREHEELEHELTSVHPRRRLDARLVLPDGTPFAERSFGVTALLRGVAIVVPGRTDADGRTVLDGGPLSEPPPRIDVQALADERDGRRVRLEARLDAAARAVDPADARVDVGTVVLRALPLAASGVVRDTDGLPVEGATVLLAYDGAAPARAPSAFSRADGRFDLWGDAAARAVGVYAHSPAVGTSATVPLGPDARDVELVLAAHGTLHVDVDLPAGFAADALAIRYQQDDGATFWLHPRHRAADGPATELRWMIEQVPPGRGTLVARASGSEFARIDVVVRPGEATDAGRIDVAGALATIELVVRDAAGIDLEHVTVLDASVHPPRALVTSAKSPMTLPAPRRGARWRIAAPDKRTTTVDVAGARVEVVLEEAPAIELRLPAGYPTPGAAHGSLWLKRLGGDGLANLPLSPDNRYTARFGEPGRWSARFRPANGSGSVVLGAGGHEFHVTAADLASGGPIELPIDLDTWTRFLAEATPR